MKRILNWIPALALVLVFTGYMAFAQQASAPAPAAAVASPSPVAAAPAVAQPAQPAQAAQPQIPVGDFAGQVLDAIKSFGGLGWMARVALILSLLIGSMRVSFLAPLWEKIPDSLKFFVAPLLAFLYALVNEAVKGNISWASLIAFMGAGGGAILLDNLLDGIKAEPWVNPKVVAFINFFESLPVVGSGKLTQPDQAAAQPAGQQAPKA